MNCYVCHPDYHLQCPTREMMMHGSLKITLRNQAVKSAKKKNSPSKTPCNKQAPLYSLSSYCWLMLIQSSNTLMQYQSAQAPIKQH